MDRRRIRLAAVQFGHRPLGSFDEFARQVAADIALARDYDCQLICFPEYLTGCLLTVPLPGGGTRAGSDPPGTDESLEVWEGWTDRYRNLFADLARRHRLWILAGTHLTRTPEGTFANRAHLFDPDGSLYIQDKLHLTPCETEPWRLTAGDVVYVVEADWGRLAVLICFDMEFPEVGRAAADAGADLLLCPSATDDRAGFWRVRYSCHARAVENQVFVVHAALVGGLPGVRFLEQSYGRAGLLAPCDVPFPADGVLAEGEGPHHLVVVGEVDLELLDRVRRAGSVTPRQWRRTGYAARVVAAGTKVL